MTGDGDLFDNYAKNYEEELAKAVGVSGEGREYFAEGRVGWLRRCLRQLGESPRSVLDFGCGDGATTPLLLSILQAASAVGLDVSAESVTLARQRHASPQVQFEPLRSFQPEGRMDLAYCNGVFHHIPPPGRPGALALVNKALRVGGLFSLWENSPWNPATRYVMSRCAFDRDAQLLTPPQTRSLLREAGFEIVRTDFRFIFPRALRALRKLEDLLYKAPLGTQYHVLSRKIR